MINQNIKCPSCAVEIDINQTLYKKLETQANATLEQEILEHRAKYKEAMGQLKSQETSVAQRELDFNKKLVEATQKEVEEKLRIERASVEQAIKLKLNREKEDEIQTLSKELNEKSEQVKELNLSKIKIQQLQREKEEIELKVKAEAQASLTEELKQEKERLSKVFEEENFLKLKEKDEQLKQIKRELDNAQRKAEQGSMQIQGEVLELVIEEWLSSQFPFDTIEEVKKGAFGADCTQTVHTREVQNCGIISYESKNTKAWSNDWIPKLKQDMLSVHADVGVLVTAVYPKDMKRMGFVDDIWVCNLEEFRGSVSLIRQSLIQVHKTLQKEENKTDKMTFLYNYLTGNEFHLQLQSIVEGFDTMQKELDKEKRSLMASWKRRQKLIDGVLQNTTEMYGSLQGIAGANTLGTIDALELYDEEEDKKLL